MNFRFVSLAGLALATALIAPMAAAQDDAKTNKAKATENPIGYFLGVSVGQGMLQQGFKEGDFDAAAFAAGVADALAGRDPALSDEQLQETRGKIEALLQKRHEAMVAENKRKAILNKEKGLVWLKENAKKEGIQTIDGGIQYKVLESGKGSSPSASDMVKVHYTGKLINGKVFDSSVQKGKPAEFLVGDVIQGWQRALQKMKVGDKWMLYIPPDMAYGERGRPGAIGPNEVLVFEVQLLDII